LHFPLYIYYLPINKENKEPKVHLAVACCRIKQFQSATRSHADSLLKFPFSIIPDRFWWVLIFFVLSGMGGNAEVKLAQGFGSVLKKYEAGPFVF
jgi:hypothetical protein